MSEHELSDRIGLSSREKVINSALFANILSTVLLLAFGLNHAAIIFYIATVSIIIIASGKMVFPLGIWLNYLTILVAFCGPIFIHWIVYQDSSLKEFLHFAIAITAGLSLSRFFEILDISVLLKVVCVLAVLDIFLISLSIKSLSVNRTYFTVPILILWFCFAFQANSHRLSWFLTTSVVLVAVYITASRSSFPFVFLAWLLALITVFISKGVSGWQKMLLIFCSAIATLVMLFYFDNLLDSQGVVGRFIERGMDTERGQMWSWYIDNCDLQCIAFGMDLEWRQQRMALDVFGDDIPRTLHSSIFQLHSIGGVAPVLAAVYIMVRVATRIFKFEKKTAIISASAAVITKAFLDVSMLPQRFDLLLFAIFFYSLEVRSGVDFCCKKLPRVSPLY